MGTDTVCFSDGIMHVKTLSTRLNVLHLPHAKAHPERVNRRVTLFTSLSFPPVLLGS